MEKKNNVLSIVPQLEKKRKESVEFISIKEALEEAYKSVNKEPDKDDVFSTCNKLVIIALQDEKVNGEYVYSSGFIQSGMKMSEMISLLERTKLRCLQLMGKL